MAIGQEVAPVISALAILKDFNTGRIKQTLLDLPEAIKAKKAMVNGARQALKQADALRAEREVEIKFEISTATDEAGKKMFSNAEARDGELVRRKAVDPGYIEANGAVVAAQERLDLAQDEYQEAVDRFRAYGTVAGLVESELNLYARLGVEKPQERQAF
jgi:hypothetical protein